MSDVTDVIVIGSGVNGLVAGALLAKQKLSVIVLDQCPVVGGAAITTELAPGYRAPTLGHAIAPISRDIIRALRLDRAGLEFVTPDPALTALTDDGRALVFHRDRVLTAASINALSSADAGRWIDFTRSMQQVAGVIGRLNEHAPPSIDALTRQDWWRLLGVGRHARSIGRRELKRLARWMPMSVADLTGEWFETDVLRAAIAAHAIFGNPAGPRSAGTGAMLLGRIAADGFPVGSGGTVKGGPGALTAALAAIATRYGASVRTDARIMRVLTEDGRASGVVLANGDQISARAVVAAISPTQVFVDLVSPEDLPPTFRERMSHVRSRGVTAKINLAVSDVPSFTAFGGDRVPLAGRLLIAPGLDYLERAFDATKYGAMSERPWLEISIPTIADQSLAPAGSHVMSIAVHFMPRHLRGTKWATAREALARSVMQVLEPHAPQLANQIIAQEILTPEDLEQRWGLPGGHIFHGESTLDQTWAARPLLGWAGYRTPIRGLYLASAGTHPGGGLTGQSGWLASQVVGEDFKKRAI
jgi:phytoene dehydrogenase-like protein